MGFRVRRRFRRGFLARPFRFVCRLSYGTGTGPTPRPSLYLHPDSAVRVRNDLLRWIMGFSSLTRMGWELTNNGTVSASVLGSFGFGHGAFTPPVRSLLTPAAAHKRLAAAPSGETSPRRAESMVAFVNTMLHGRSAALPGRRESAALGSRFLRERPANHARYLN